MRTYANRGKGVMPVRKFAYKYLVLKLLAIITRFFVGFMKKHISFIL